MSIMGYDKVETIKDYAEMIIGIPKEDQIVLFNNKNLREEERLEDLGMQNNSVAIIKVRIKGGKKE